MREILKVDNGKFNKIWSPLKLAATSKICLKYCIIKEISDIASNLLSTPFLKVPIPIYVNDDALHHLHWDFTLKFELLNISLQTI